MRLKYFLYARKSSDAEERQIKSIEQQLSELKEFAAKEKSEIVGILQEAKTAKEPGRSLFNEMLKRIEKGEANAILAWHPDRLARNSVDGGYLIYLLDSGKLFDLKFPIFWFENTPQGKFMINIAFGQSKYYVDNLAENIKRGIRQKLRTGIWPQWAPLGYVNDHKNKCIAIDAEKAKLIHRVFELYATGNYSFTELRAIAKDIGLKAKKQGPLSRSNIQYLLKNPIYYGLIRYNGEVYEGAHEPLISKQLFDKVEEVMTDRSRPKKKKLKDYAFRGLFRCGECGAMITAETQKGHNYYRCTKKIKPCSQSYVREEKLLEQVKEILKQASLCDKWTNLMLDELEKEKANQKESVRVAAEKSQNNLNDIENKLGRLLDLYLEKLISSEEYQTKKFELVNQKVALKQKLEEVRAQGRSWLEPMQEFIIEANQREKVIETGDPKKILESFKNIGSNFLLQEKTLRFQWAQPHFLLAQAAQSAPRASWRRGRDSNSRCTQGAYWFSRPAYSTTLAPLRYFGNSTSSHLLPAPLFRNCSLFRASASA